MAQFANRAFAVFAVFGLIAACGNAGGVDTPSGDPEPDDVGPGGSAGSGGDSSGGQPSTGGASTAGGNTSAGHAGAGGDSAGTDSAGGAATGGHAAGAGGVNSAGKGGMASSAGGATAGSGGATFGAGGSSVSVPMDCAGANGEIGCCSADGMTAYFCTPAGKFTTKSCTSGNACGWDSTNSFYNCGGNGVDPNGDNPMVCGGGSGTGGSGTTNIIPTTCAEAHGDPGCCAPDGNEYYCTSTSGTSIKMAKCDAGTCGWNAGSKQYGCGQSPDPDPSGKNPINCGPLEKAPRARSLHCITASIRHRGRMRFRCDNVAGTSASNFAAFATPTC